VYIEFECTINRLHEQNEQQQGIYFHSLVLHENATLANHGRRLQGQFATTNLWYALTEIAKNGVAAGTIHGHSAAVVARLICCRERHFFLT
jgi:hypothetical protein